MRVIKNSQKLIFKVGILKPATKMLIFVKAFKKTLTKIIEIIHESVPLTLMKIMNHGSKL